MLFETERLVVRDLTDDDAPALYEMHRRDEVMRWLDRTLSTGVADELARLERWRAVRRDGFGWFAITLRETGALVGVQVFKPFDDLPHVDLGWRLHPDHWGNGYATEAARGAIAYGFGTLGLDEIAATTLPGNARSRAVMERLGMTYAGDVIHAGLPHVLYLLRRPA
ncbi:MAG TPA: GNAT family N-acetyltransferase [Frankiaceae bacterium]|nr:GNAT family N-acetyltransferase [Frankiaceae bacterium]